jgi:hypothetical protein
MIEFSALQEEPLTVKLGRKEKSKLYKAVAVPRLLCEGESGETKREIKLNFSLCLIIFKHYIMKTHEGVKV